LCRTQRRHLGCAWLRLEMVVQQPLPAAAAVACISACPQLRQLHLAAPGGWNPADGSLTAQLRVAGASLLQELRLGRWLDDATATDLIGLIGCVPTIVRLDLPSVPDEHLPLLPQLPLLRKLELGRVEQLPPLPRFLRVNQGRMPQLQRLTLSQLPSAPDCSAAWVAAYVCDLLPQLEELAVKYGQLDAAAVLAQLRPGVRLVVGA
jgi:hypothetical protein